MDIFEKDFLILPIHDHLHWSLVIICHPGVPSEEDSCTPWILHLDSMTCASHSCSGSICRLVRAVCQDWVECYGVGAAISSFRRPVYSQSLIFFLLCSWSRHFKDQEGAAGVPHPGVGPEGAARSLLFTLILAASPLTPHPYLSTMPKRLTFSSC